MDVFLVKKWAGELVPGNEVAEMKWIGSDGGGLKLGSILEHEILPRLKKQGLID